MASVIHADVWALVTQTFAWNVGTSPCGSTLRTSLVNRSAPRLLALWLCFAVANSAWANSPGEMASLERLAWRAENNTHFVIIGISTDDYVGKAANLLKNTNATISQFIDTRLQMEDMLGASTLPLTVLVGADGKVIAKFYGARQWDEADAARLIDDAFRKTIR
jgi:hypothetical protein